MNPGGVIKCEIFLPSQDLLKVISKTKLKIKKSYFPFYILCHIFIIIILFNLKFDC